MFKLYKLFAWAYILFGTVLIFNGFSGFTGMVIFEEFSFKDSSLFGVFLVLLGLLILKVYREDEYDSGSKYENDYHGPRLKGSRELREHNRQGHYGARTDFVKSHGRAPDKMELRHYTRHLHETGELHELIDEKRHRKRAG